MTYELSELSLYIARVREFRRSCQELACSLGPKVQGVVDSWHV